LGDLKMREHLRTEFIIQWKNQLFLLAYQNTGSWTRDKKFFSFNLDHTKIPGQKVLIETDGSKFPAHFTGEIIAVRKNTAIEKGYEEYEVIHERELGDFYGNLYKVIEAHNC
jgi:hypothetical protein